MQAARCVQGDGRDAGREVLGAADKSSGESHLRHAVEHAVTAFVAADCADKVELVPEFPRVS